MNVLPSRRLRVVVLCFLLLSITWLVGCAPAVKHVPVVVRTSLISPIQPRYPPKAIRQRHQGTVIVLLTVDQHGLVTDARIAQSSGFDELDRAAVTATRQWVFKPKTVDGIARASIVRIPVNFNLNYAPAPPPVPVAPQGGNDYPPPPPPPPAPPPVSQG